jgi:hypothetical protein
LARISDGRPRHGAERLVAAGYATSRPLNLSDVEYEITPLGRTALVLNQYGIRSTNFSAIEPCRFEVDGRWHVKVTSVDQVPQMLGIGAATQLAAHLRTINAIELAERFERESQRTGSTLA